MEDRTSLGGLAVTRDHVHPKSKGGRKIVLACRTCNAIKGNMLPDDWKAFMQSFPRWWENDNFTKEPAKVTYATAWDANGNPYSFNAPRRIRATKAETQRKFAEMQAHAKRERQRDAKSVPYRESMMVLRHGKDYWKAWKASGGEICECCRKPPPNGVLTFTAQGCPVVPRMG